MSLPSSRDDQNWIWRTPAHDLLYYDNHETVRFRVEEEHWFDHTPLGPQADDAHAHAPQRPPYSLVGSMEDPGLGPCLWWDG